MLITRQNYQPASNGEHAAVLADIVDLGTQVSQFGPKHRLKCVFITEEKDDEGEPIRVTDFCTVSTHKTSKLSAYIKALTGKLPSKQFETEDMIGLALTLTTEQTEKDGDIYANVARFGPLKKGMKAPSIPLNFQRTGTDKQSQPSKPNGTARKKVGGNLHGVDVSDESCSPATSQVTKHERWRTRNRNSKLRRRS